MKKLIDTFVLLLMVTAPPVAMGGGAGDDHGHGPAESRNTAVTLWTDTLELFMEYPLLTPGQPGRFIIHLTVLDGFQPVRAGSVTLGFRGPDGARHQVVAESLLREGIFAPTVTLPRAGLHEFTLDYRGPGTTGSFLIEGFTVYASAGAMPPEEEGAAGGDIGFLKEQQWKLPFATVTVAEREIKQSVWAIGRVLPAPAAHAEIASPVDGVVQAGGRNDLALPGAEVRRGDVVARIAPPLSGNGWTEADLAFQQAERNYERARRLREQDAISVRQFEEAENEFLTRKAGHRRLAGGGSDGVLSLTAPIGGRVMDWQVRPGQYVRAGDRLMSIVDPAVVWLQANVYESDFRDLGTPVEVFVNPGGETGGWTIPAADLRVLSTGGALDPATRTIPVLLEIRNGDGRLTINESTPLELYTSRGEAGLAVPRSAVYRDEGVDVVFVQTGGESFVKRTVKVGPHYADWVSIIDGLQPGERVVSRGGYHVKLASTTTEIGHGHAH